MRFTSVVQQNGRTATGIPVPTEVVESLGGGRRPKVRVTINGYTYRNSVVPWGDDGYMLSLSAAHRAGAGIGADDTVTVEIALDTAPREVDVDPDFAAALAADPTASAFFDSLSYSKKRYFTEGLASAKKPETRTARIAKYVAMLHDHRDR